MEILRETPWSRIKGQNSVYKEFLEIFGNGVSNGQCSRGDNCSFRHEINKRGKMTQSNTSPNYFMQQNDRKASRTQSPRGKSPSGRMSRWPCKDYLKGTCTNSFVQSGTLQYACSTRPRVVVGLGKSAHSHIVRLMNSLVKGTKNDDKSAVATLKKNDWHKTHGNLLSTMLKVTIDQGDLMRNVITSWNEDLQDVDHLTHGNSVVYFKTWSRRSPFSGRALTCRNQSNVVTIHEGYCTSH